MIYFLKNYMLDIKVHVHVQYMHISKILCVPLIEGFTTVSIHYSSKSRYLKPVYMYM